MKHHEINITKKNDPNEKAKDRVKHLIEKKFSPNIFTYSSYIIIGIFPKYVSFFSEMRNADKSFFA